MHRTALACAVTSRAAGDLRHQSIDVRSFGDGMAVRTMATEDIIVLSELSTGSNRHRLLADSEMQQADNLPRGIKRRNFLLERTNEVHGAQEGHKFLLILRFLCHGSRPEGSNSREQLGKDCADSFDNPIFSRTDVLFQRRT